MFNEDAPSQQFVHNLYAPMCLIPERAFQAFGAIPSNDAARELNLLTTYPSDPQLRRNTMVVYVSHRWLQPTAIYPQPDNAARDKHRIVCEGLRLLRQSLGVNDDDGDVNVLLWIDFTCLPGSESRRTKSILSLPGFMERSDVVLLPVLPNSSYPKEKLREWTKHPSRTLIAEISNKLDQTSGDFLTEHVHCQDLFSRAWVRLETMLASVVPTSDPARFQWFAQLGSTRDDRPIVMCASGQQTTVLPRISGSIIHAFDPERGQVTNDQNMSLIAELKSTSLATLAFSTVPSAFMEAVENGPVYDQFFYDSGNVRELSRSKAHARIASFADDTTADKLAATKPSPADGPRSISNNGAKYTGTWVNGLLQGKATVAFDEGGSFDGFYVKGQPHGKAIYCSPTGRVEAQYWENGALVKVATPSDTLRTQSMSSSMFDDKYLMPEKQKLKRVSSRRFSMPSSLRQDQCVIQ